MVETVFDGRWGTVMMTTCRRIAEEGWANKTSMRILVGVVDAAVAVGVSVDFGIRRAMAWGIPAVRSPRVMAPLQR